MNGKILTAAALALATSAALAGDGLKSGNPFLPSGPNEIKRARFLGADTTPTKAGSLEGGPHALAFSPDGKLLAMGGIDGAVAVAQTNESSDSASGWHRTGEHTGSVAGVAFLAGTGPLTLVSVGDDETIRTAALDASLAVVSSASRSLNMGPLTALAVLDAGRVVVGSARGQIAIVSLGDRIAVDKVFERHEGAVAALVALSKDRFASAGWDGLVKISDTSGKELKAAKLSTVELTALAVSPDGKTLAVGSWKKGVALVEASSLKTIATLEPHRGGAHGLLLAGPAKAGFDKCRLVSASLADEMLAASEPLGAKAKLDGVKRTRLVAVPTGALALSPDGALVACAANDGSVGLYQLEGK